MSVEDIDHGWAQMMEAASMAAKGPVVAVGIQGQDAGKTTDEHGEITMVVLGGVHEFGTQDQHIPSRSFIRWTVDDNKQKYEKLQARLLGLVLQGKLTVSRALGLLGQQVQSDIQRAFEQGLEPDLAESTKARRLQGDGSRVFKPLIDTGQLKQSITYEVRE